MPYFDSFLFAKMDSKKCAQLHQCFGSFLGSMENRVGLSINQADR